MIPAMKAPIAIESPNDFAKNENAKTTAMLNMNNSSGYFAA